MRLHVIAVVALLSASVHAENASTTLSKLKSKIESTEKTPTLEDFTAKACWPWSAGCEEKAKNDYKIAMNGNVNDFDPAVFAKEMARQMKERTADAAAIAAATEQAAAKHEQEMNEGFEEANAAVGFVPGSTDWKPNQESWAVAFAKPAALIEERQPTLEEFTAKACFPWSAGCEEKAKHDYKMTINYNINDFDPKIFAKEMAREMQERAADAAATAKATEEAAAANEQAMNKGFEEANAAVGFVAGSTDWKPSQESWVASVAKPASLIEELKTPTLEEFTAKACFPWSAGCEEKAKHDYQAALENNVGDFDPEIFAKEMARQMRERAADLAVTAKATEHAAAANEQAMNKGFEDANAAVGFVAGSTDWKPNQESWAANN